MPVELPRGTDIAEGSNSPMAPVQITRKRQPVIFSGWLQPIPKKIKWLLKIDRT
jgi:hypothetical protein